MKLNYGTLISPYPIRLSIGTIRQPKLKEIFNPAIAGLSFDKFQNYQVFLKLTPEIFYTEIKKDTEAEKYWDSLSEEQQNEMTLLDIMDADKDFREAMLEVLQFFFVERVMYFGGYILILNEMPENIEALKPGDVAGILDKNTLPQAIDIIQQICCIKTEEEVVDDSKFKNDTARKLYAKMLKGRKERKKANDINLTLPNLISAISAKHPSYNLINIWDLTIFQLFDVFNRMQVDSVYQIDSIRVSVWGDEKKKFNIALWYKNEFDKPYQTGILPA